jgi:hypothetical protein
MPKFVISLSPPKNLLLQKELMPTDKAKKHGGDETPGYPLYAPSQDIYNHDKKDTHINPDDNSEISEIFDELDVPGADLDDKDEAIGKEDEENNYYSLGGDDHADLDENQGD